jgi:hypothetical protein
MSNTIRWSVLVGALLLAAAVGFAAWQAGVAHGIIFMRDSSRTLRSL